MHFLRRAGFAVLRDGVEQLHEQLLRDSRIVRVEELELAT